MWPDKEALALIESSGANRSDNEGTAGAGVQDENVLTLDASSGTSDDPFANKMLSFQQQDSSGDTAGILAGLGQAFPFDLISAMQDNGLDEKMSIFLEFWENFRFFGRIEYYFVEFLRKKPEFWHRIIFHEKNMPI